MGGMELIGARQQQQRRRRRRPCRWPEAPIGGLIRLPSATGAADNLFLSSPLETGEAIRQFSLEFRSALTRLAGASIAQDIISLSFKFKSRLQFFEWWQIN